MSIDAGIFWAKLGKQLQRSRMYAGFKVDEVSRCLDIDVEALEGGRLPIDVLIFTRMAVLYGRSLDALVGGTTSKAIGDAYEIDEFKEFLRNRKRS